MLSNYRQYWGFLCQVAESAIDERTHPPAVDVLVWSFAGGVVAAGQDFTLEVDAVCVEGLDHFKRVFEREGQIVPRVNQQDLLGKFDSAL